MKKLTQLQHHTPISLKLCVPKWAAVFTALTFLASICWMSWTKKDTVRSINQSSVGNADSELEKWWPEARLWLQTASPSTKQSQRAEHNGAGASWETSASRSSGEKFKILWPSLCDQGDVASAGTIYYTICVLGRNHPLETPDYTFTRPRAMDVF